MSENLIKSTCRELGITYKQLGELIGLSEASIKRLATSDEISQQVIRSCEMAIEIHRLKEKTQSLEIIKKALKNLMD